MEKCRRSYIEKEVLSKVKPSRNKNREIKTIVDAITMVIEEYIKKNNIDAEITIEGSYAKGTWLADELDVDLFILAKPELCKKITQREFVEELETYFRERSYRVKREYAQHPYLAVIHRNISIDIVPGCKVESPKNIQTAVDRTPFHRKYVLARLSEEQKDEVRLLKSFMKGINVYGAEVGVKGFSGYLAELLIVRYKCFRNVLEAASRWIPPVVIDIENHYEEKKKLIEKYPQQPLIVVDPVDPSRNAAAAVSLKSLATFIFAAQKYLEKPSIKYFHIQRIEKEEKKKIEVPCLIICLKPDSEISRDNLWGTIQRIARTLAKTLKNYDAKVVNYATYCPENAKRGWIILEFESTKLPPYREYRGPPVWMKEHAKKFLKKHLEYKDTVKLWINEEGRLAALVKQRITNIEKIIEEILSKRDLLPKHARNYEIQIMGIPQATQEMNEEERKWLVNTVMKNPPWAEDTT